MNAWLDGRQLPISKVLLRRDVVVNEGGRFGTTYMSKASHGGSVVRSPTHSARDEACNVIVKVCEWKNDKRTMAQFCAEAFLAGALQHKNILSPSSVSFETLPMAVATLHLQNGNLRNFLRACRPTAPQRKETLGVKELLHICAQAAAACEYLESCKVIHRSLMASNVLVGLTHRDVRLSGFGSLRGVLAAEEYIQTSDTKGTHLDIRYMAVEAFTENKFSVKSDLWSYAVMVWEIMSFARKPYGAFNPGEVAGEVRAGRRLEKAENCPVELHAMLLKAWSNNPLDRSVNMHTGSPNMHTGSPAWTCTPVHLPEHA